MASILEMWIERLLVEKTSFYGSWWEIWMKKLDVK